MTQQVFDLSFIDYKIKVLSWKFCLSLNEILTEAECYLQSALINLTYISAELDKSALILKMWQVIAKNYLTLTLMTCDVLSISASKVNVEHLFSKSYNIIQYKYNCLKN